MTSPTKKPFHILVAEDDDGIRFLISHIFGRIGVTADMAKNGDEAVRLCAEKAYHLVLLDIEMPYQTGFEVAAKIRQFDHARKKKTVIYIASAHRLIDVVEKLRNADLDGFVQKPLTEATLRRVIELAREGEGDFFGEIGDALPHEPSPRARLYDLTDIRHLVADDAESLRDCLAVFYDSVAGNIAQLEEEIAKGKKERAQISAHSLKGIFAQFQATEAAFMAAEIEKEAQKGESDKLRKKVAKLKRQADKIVTALKREFGDNPTFE